MSWNDCARSFARFDAQQELIRRKQEERKRQLAEQEFRQRMQHRVRTSRGDFYDPPQEPRSANPTYNPHKPSSGNSSFYDPPRRANMNRPVTAKAPEPRPKPAATTTRQETVEINVANQVIDPRKHIITKYVSEFFTPYSKRPVTKAETVIVTEPGLSDEPKVKETLAFMKQKEHELMQVIQNSDRAGKWTYQAPAKQGIVKATTTVMYNPQATDPYSNTITIMNGVTYKRPPPPRLQRRQSSIDLPAMVPSINIEDASFQEEYDAYRRVRKPNHRSISSFDEESLDDPQPTQQQRRIRFSNQNSFYRYPPASSVYEDEVVSSGATVTRPTASRPVNSGASSGSGIAAEPVQKILFKKRNFALHLF